MSTLASEGKHSPLVQIVLGVMTIVFASGLSWIGWTVSDTQRAQSAANARAEERWDAVIFRLQSIESKISSQYSQREAEQAHKRLRRSINHTWEAHKALEIRVNKLERGR